MKFYESLTIPFTKEFRKVTPTSKPRWYYTFTCPICNTPTTKVKANNFKWCCTKCSHTTSSTEEFIKKSKAKFGDLYAYEKTTVLNARTKVTLTCKLHGDFKVRIADHLHPKRLAGCPTCGNLVQKSKVTTSITQWKQKLQDKFSNKFKIVSYNTVGYHAAVVIECPDHGQFTTTFGAIQKNKHLCSKCASHNHQKQSVVTVEPFGRLYYVYIPSIDMYKLGVTVFKSSSLATTKHIKLWEKLYTYQDAIALEHLIHTRLSEFRYKGSKKLLRAGNTELYKQNVENLILDILSRASQKEFCVERILNGETPFTEDNPVLNE